MHALRKGLHTAIVEHGLKSGPNRTRADHAPTSRVDTHDVVLFRPARHELLDVRVVQGFVKGLLDVIGRTANHGRLQFGAFHGFVLFQKFIDSFCLVCLALACVLSYLVAAYLSQNKKPGHSELCRVFLLHLVN